VLKFQDLPALNFDNAVFGNNITLSQSAYWETGWLLDSSQIVASVQFFLLSPGDSLNSDND
jgi:hypothetical protein